MPLRVAGSDFDRHSQCLAGLFLCQPNEGAELTTSAARECEKVGAKAVYQTESIGRANGAATSGSKGGEQAPQLGFDLLG
jgi:hypothetical protein